MIEVIVNDFRRFCEQLGGKVEKEEYFIDLGKARELKCILPREKMFYLSKSGILINIEDPDTKSSWTINGRYIDYLSCDNSIDFKITDIGIETKIKAEKIVLHLIKRNKLGISILS